jgi:NAD(P)-dependent dehydrogenase (short-subunit alcohol dehydrogenase family)
MHSYFQERHFLITGGASGIGLTTARLLKAQGARLSLWDVNEAALRQAGETLGAQTAVVDITEPAQVEWALTEALNRHGSLHGVIHAAGIMHTGPFEAIPPAAHRRLIDINLFGTVLVAQTAVAALRATRGSLVLLSSISAFYGPPEFAAYGATKAGVLGFAQAIRLELEQSGIHVGVVCPFFVATPLIEGQQTRLFKRFGVAHTPEAVAQSILNGIRRRRFMIWTGAQPAIFHWLSHAGYPLRHLFMRLWWR